MMATNIEWTARPGTTGETLQVTVGCRKVSDGCTNCYAERMAGRLAAMGYADEYRDNNPGRKALYRHVVKHKRISTHGLMQNVALPQWNGKVFTVPDALTDPLRWKKPRTIFVNSMSDLFHEDVPFEFIDRVFAVAALCPQHTLLILTKRPGRMAEYLNREGVASYIADQAKTFGVEPPMGINAYAMGPKDEQGRPEFGDRWFIRWPLPNVWLGTSVENQQAANERIPHLLRCPAAVRFLSCEPLLGPVDLKFQHEVLIDVMDTNPDRSERHRGEYPFPYLEPEYRTRRRDAIDWVIVGGESGPGARPCDTGDVRKIVGQCRDAAVPVFVKQLGSKPRYWPCGAGPECGHPDCGWEDVKLKNSKGGDMSEWPPSLRVREFPQREQEAPDATD